MIPLKKTYHEKKVDANGNQLDEVIALDKLDKRTKSSTLPIRMTPFEKAKLLIHCEKQNCDMVDLFRPIIEKIAKKK